MRSGITVIAYMTAKSGHEEQIRQALLDLVVQTRKERGCIDYDLHQSHENATEFVMYENWATPADLDAHANSIHLQAFARNAGPLLKGPVEISKWTMVSETQVKQPMSFT